jgi:hypothetical protein
MVATEYLQGDRITASRTFFIPFSTDYDLGDYDYLQG